MCGIAGIIGIPGEEKSLGLMSAVLRHRGPDGSGSYTSRLVHAAATRLSIVGLEAGPQPLYNETGEISIVFNGEIYNHRELRSELTRRGHTFRTSTDTEVILHLYEEAADRCVEQLRGMFAFAIIDGGRVLLARDRIGIKPLYYTFLPGGGALLFASELKSILQHPRFTPRLDRQTLADYLVLRYSASPASYIEGVSMLPAGHIMVVDAGGPAEAAPRPYYTPDFARRDELSLDEAEAVLFSTLGRAVETHLDADVEVGLTLSGGLDSTVLALLARERANRPLTTFAVGDDAENVDLQQAAQIAGRIGSRHYTTVVSFDEYVEAIPAMLAAHEQPTNLFGVPFFLLCRRIGGHLKACLHGEGADELFGGYEDYVDRDSKLALVRARLPLLRALGVAPSPQALATIQRLAAKGSMDDYLRTTFEINFGDPLEKQHLIPVDKLAMAFGLELRVPYLADEVYQFVNRLPIRFLVRSDLKVSKYLLKKLVLKRFGPEVADVVLREKRGFPSAGIRHVTRFDRLCETLLPDSYPEGHEFGGCFRTKRELLIFDMYCQIFLEHRGDFRALGGTMDFIHARQNRSAINGSPVPNGAATAGRSRSYSEMQACLARLYVDEPFRKLYFLDRSTLNEYRLTPEEIAAIEGIDREKLDYFAQSLANKRRGRIERAYPMLSRLNATEFSRYYMRYYQLYPARPNQSSREDVVEFGQFAEESLAGARALPPYAAEIARYERLHYQARFTPNFTRPLPAPREETGPERVTGDDTRVWVRDGVEIVDFEYDMSAIEERLHATGKVPDASSLVDPATIAFRPATAASEAKILRLNAATREVLDRCDGRPAGAIVAGVEAAFGNAGLYSQVIGVLERMLALEVVTLSPDLARIDRVSESYGSAETEGMCELIAQSERRPA